MYKPILSYIYYINSTYLFYLEAKIDAYCLYCIQKWPLRASQHRIETFAAFDIVTFEFANNKRLSFFHSLSPIKTCRCAQTKFPEIVFGCANKIRGVRTVSLFNVSGFLKTNAFMEFQNNRVSWQIFIGDRF